MAPPQVFVIDLDNGDRVFFPGNTISGRVTLQTTLVKKLRGIYLTLIGRAIVRWGTSDTAASGQTQTTPPTYDKVEDPYFNFRVNLWGGDEGEQFLQPGSYQFPYSFRLPEVPLPTSHENHTGQIRYWLEARLDRPWKFDYVTKRAFTILERVNLNLCQEDLSDVRRGENQKTVGLLCCETGPLSLTVSTDRGGYCPGENILVTAHVENNTSKEMKRIKATLHHRVVYYGYRQANSISNRNTIKSSNDIVCQMQTNDRIPAGGNFEWNQQPLPIPACPPSSKTCKIIHIDYVLDIEVVAPTFCTNLHIKIPIVIGTQPLRSVYANTTLPTIEWFQADAVNIADDQYTMGQTQFAPLLPMVQLPQAGDDPPPQYPENIPTQPAPPYPEDPIARREDPPPRYPGNGPAQPSPPYPEDPTAQSSPTQLPTEPYPAPYPPGTVQPAAYPPPV